MTATPIPSERERKRSLTPRNDRPDPRDEQLADLCHELTQAQARATSAELARDQLAVELAAIRRVLAKVIPSAPNPGGTEALARIVAGKALAARAPRACRCEREPVTPITTQPTPIRPCPPPTDEELAWSRGRPDHLAPFWCRYCGRSFHVRRHAELHEERARTAKPVSAVAA